MPHDAMEERPVTGQRGPLGSQGSAANGGHRRRFRDLIFYPWRPHYDGLGLAIE